MDVNHSSKNSFKLSNEFIAEYSKEFTPEGRYLSSCKFLCLTAEQFLKRLFKIGGEKTVKAELKRIGLTKIRIPLKPLMAMDYNNLLDFVTRCFPKLFDIHKPNSGSRGSQNYRIFNKIREIRNENLAHVMPMPIMHNQQFIEIVKCFRDCFDVLRVPHSLIQSYLLVKVYERPNSESLIKKLAGIKDDNKFDSFWNHRLPWFGWYTPENWSAFVNSEKYEKLADFVIEELRDGVKSDEEVEKPHLETLFESCGLNSITEEIIFLVDALLIYDPEKTYKRCLVEIALGDAINRDKNVHKGERTNLSKRLIKSLYCIDYDEYHDSLEYDESLLYEMLNITIQDLDVYVDSYFEPLIVKGDVRATYAQNIKEVLTSIVRASNDDDEFDHDDLYLNRMHQVLTKCRNDIGHQKYSDDSENEQIKSDKSTCKRKSEESNGDDDEEEPSCSKKLRPSNLEESSMIRNDRYEPPDAATFFEDQDPSTSGYQQYQTVNIAEAEVVEDSDEEGEFTIEDEVGPSDEDEENNK